MVCCGISHTKVIFLAESALVTLNGDYVLDPRSPSHKWQLNLSHNAKNDSTYPRTRNLPQFLFILDGLDPNTSNVQDTNHPFRDGLSPRQAIFKLFRRAGPLVSIRVGVEIGIGPPTTVVEYWNAKDAEYATKHLPYLHRSMKGMRPFILRTFDPCKLYCAVSSPAHRNLSMI